MKLDMTYGRQVAAALEKIAGQQELANLLQIEYQLSKCAERIDNVAASVTELMGKKRSGTQIYEEEVFALNMRMAGAVQNYLNALDRLCACVLRGLFDEDHAKDDYQEFISGAIATYAGEITSDKRRNVYALAVRWGCITTTTGGSNE